MQSIPVPANEYRRQRWRNDRGWTLEIVRIVRPDLPDGAWRRLPDDDPGWDCRLSIAEIECDGPYSAYPEARRQQVLLSGAGYRLEFDDGEKHVIEPPHGRLSFPGAASVHCRLRDGAVRVLNVFSRPDRLRAEILHRPLVGAMVFFSEPDIAWFGHLLAGRARIQDADRSFALDAGDSFVLGPWPGRRRVLDGAGELLLVKLTVDGSPLQPAIPAPAGIQP